MPEIPLVLKNGGAVSLTMPDPGSAPSAFVVSLPKAGSTLFYRLMTPLANRAGLPFFSLPNTLHDIGVPARDVERGLDAVFRPTGYTYGGYRGIEPGMELPPYADGRTVALIRDPRDMLTSLYFSEAKSHVAPGSSASDTLLKQFEERRRRAQSTAIDDFVLGRAAGLLFSFETVLRELDGKAHKLFRYEDVIFDKRRWVDETIAYLGFAVPDKLVRTVVEKNDVRPSGEDDAKHIRKVAPGDHLDKLRPETIAELDRVFAAVLQRFGYVEAPAAPTAAADPVGAETPEQRGERLRAERRAERVAQRVADRRTARER